MGSLEAPSGIKTTRNIDVEFSAPETDLERLKKDIESYTATGPLNVVEMAIDIAVERARTTEATKARDAVVQRLADAQESLRQKTTTIELLQQGIQQKSRTSSPFTSDQTSTLEKIEMVRMKAEISQLERTVVELRNELKLLKEKQNVLKANEPPPRYEEDAVKATSGTSQTQVSPPTRPIRSSSFPQTLQTTPPIIPAEFAALSIEASSDYRMPLYHPVSEEPADMVAARNAILSNLALPEEVPDDTLCPLSIPATLMLQDFISSLSGPLRNSISQHRLFYAATTLWCPEREEHGYFYAPLFKCSTNPRVATAHRWNAVDVIARMNKPTECFFNKDGTWYYAGVYKAFRLADLTTKEWAELPTETTQAIVKETIVARKNTSPQNIYEVTQLYAAGALKVACVGLQCVGFNNAMYQLLLEQARAFTQSKWTMGTTAGTNTFALGKASPVPMSAPTNTSSGITGLGSGSIWNASANIGLGTAGVGNGTTGGIPSMTPADSIGDLVSGLGGLSLGHRSEPGNRDEHIPTPVGDGRKR